MDAYLKKIKIFKKNFVLHCVPKKVSPLMFDNNFGKCGLIFKIFLPGDL